LDSSQQADQWKGGNGRDVGEGSPRSIDLRQGFSSLPSRRGDADTFERFGPQLANLGVTYFKG
jgi:hypothetical protein